MTQVLVTHMASEGWSELREENTKLRQQVSLLEEVTAERDTLIEELELARGGIEELEANARQDQQFRVRLAAVEPEARAADGLRRKVKGLGDQIGRTNAAKANRSNIGK